jgi:hypothetical protein
MAKECDGLNVMNYITEHLCDDQVDLETIQQQNKSLQINQDIWEISDKGVCGAFQINLGNFFHQNSRYLAPGHLEWQIRLVGS